MKARLLLETEGGFSYAFNAAILQYILHLAGDDLHGHILHLGAILDIAERRVIVRVSSTRHDVIRSSLRLAEHSEIRVPHAVEIEIMNTELADPLALIPQGRRLDVLPVRLRADNFDAWPRGRVALFKGDNLSDVAPLVILCRDNVVVEIILSIIEFVLRLLTFPTLEEGENDLCIEGKRPTAAVGFIRPEKMAFNSSFVRSLSTHSKPLYFLRNGNRHALHIAIIP